MFRQRTARRIHIRVAPRTAASSARSAAIASARDARAQLGHEFVGRLLVAAIGERARGAVPGEALHDRRADLFDDMEAVIVGAKLGLGIGLAGLSLVLPTLESGELVRVLPKWHADAGAVSSYFASQKQLPAKTRAFVDYVVAYFRRERLASRFRAG